MKKSRIEKPISEEKIIGVLRDFVMGNYSLQEELEFYMSPFDPAFYSAVSLNALLSRKVNIGIWKLSEKFSNVFVIDNHYSIFIVHSTDIFYIEKISYQHNNSTTVNIGLRSMNSWELEDGSFYCRDVSGETFQAVEKKKLKNYIHHCTQLFTLLSKESGCKFQEGKPY